jgi:hypothetical protein
VNRIAGRAKQGSSTSHPWENKQGNGSDGSDGLGALTYKVRLDICPCQRKMDRGREKLSLNEVTVVVMKEWIKDEADSRQRMSYPTWQFDLASN